MIELDFNHREKAAGELAGQGFTVLRGAFSREVCTLATNRLRRELDSQLAGPDPLPALARSSEPVPWGRFAKDEQCPLSYSVYNDEMLRYLLEEFRPGLSALLRTELTETYCYARIYQPGEVLAPHRDRHACEISATLALGYDGEPWPIHFETADAPVRLEVGDLALYRGHDLTHWREPYTQGSWQAQVFLHYVDARGPMKAYAGDAIPAQAGDFNG